MYQAVIVDDEPVIVSGIRDALDWEGFGFEIALASTSPATVLRFLAVHPVHLLITDISMPEMDGIALIREAKALVPLLSVIVLSAYDNFDYVKGALRYGAENYLLKPLSSDELSDSIRNVVSHVKEREVLNLNYGGTMLTFRSTFVEQWLKNLLTPETLLERAGLLGINLEMDNYTAVIFSADNRNAVSMSQFFDFLLSLLPGRLLAHFYFEMPYRLVCIFSRLSPSMDIRSFILHLLALSESMGISISASMGDTVPFYQSVWESYRQACSTLFCSCCRVPFVSHDDFLEEEIVQKLQKLLEKGGTDAFCEYYPDLYAQYQPFCCSVTLTSCLLLYLSADLDELPEKYPGLAGLLLPFPGREENADSHCSYIKRLAEECTAIKSAANQSMYPCVNAVIKTIEDFKEKDISLKTLAARLNVSPSYLGTVFKQQTGYYFNDYLTEARIRYAAKLIETTDMKMKDIVEKVGFSSQTYFNRMFKRFFDVSPVTYRRDKKVKNPTAGNGASNLKCRERRGI